MLLKLSHTSALGKVEVPSVIPPFLASALSRLYIFLPPLCAASLWPGVLARKSLLVQARSRTGSFIRSSAGLSLVYQEPLGNPSHPLKVIRTWSSLHIGCSRSPTVSEVSVSLAVR